ncbi:hypothetical protein [Lysobacter enzymogenes]|uniref:hypothetical protein n=1 Tax=Lysobacter enzymogenes TaxID=69 RepID=UPI001AF5DB68|nr:hypothetical protein [Lysobacter enzymogenes]QQQ02906.1 hypothetical protein JHW41_08080 [Lysobacter enzymogenes]
MTEESRGQAGAGLDYWILNYSSAPFHREGLSFRDYAPALYLGITGRVAYPSRPFEQILSKLEARYPHVRGMSPLEWLDAIPVARAAWERARDDGGRL